MADPARARGRTAEDGKPLSYTLAVKALLWGYLVQYRSTFGFGILIQTLAVSFGLTTPWLLRQAIDAFSGLPHLGWSLEAYAAAIIAVAFVEAILRYASRRMLTGGSREVENHLRNRFFAHLQTLHFGYFQEHRTGDLVARATNDLSAVRQLFSPALQQTTNTLLVVGLTLVWMFQISTRLALWATLIVPVTMALLVIFRRRIQERFTGVQEQFAVLADHAQETFAGQRVVKAYAQEQAEVDVFRAKSRDYVRRQLAQSRVSGILWPSMTLVVGLLTVLLLYVGGFEVIQGRLSIGEFVQFSAYVGLLAWPMLALGWVSTIAQQGFASLRRILEVLHARPAIADVPSPRRVDRLQGALELRGVTLVLHGQTVLDEVTLSVPAGATYAFVGPLGSGKSLLASLITRLYDPTSGQVLIDGIDVRELPLALLRRQVGYVPQETFLFSGSIRDNVAFGIDEHEATTTRVQEAVRISRLESDVDQWQSGLETIVGERGVTLSGGQKQRAAIARAVAKDPAILILDDALSSVDTRTEEMILANLRAFMAARTSLMIAHRLSSISHADRIVVLRDGRIVEQGTHQELVRLGGLYTGLYRRQLIAQELGVGDDQRDDDPGRLGQRVGGSSRADGWGEA